MPVVSFNDILGQAGALRVLKAALASGRVHHAWIFHGPPGVGKFTTALAFASALLDPTTQQTFSGDFEPDPESETQRLIAQDLHPDLHIITKELALFVDSAQVRSAKQTTIAKDVIDQHLLRPASVAPVMRSDARIGKAFIIDEAELLNPSSQNALLKTLEEPAPRTVIMLVTSAVERLLPTIRSRCQRVAFETLSDDDMKEWLKRWSKTREEPPSKADASWAIDFAAGSPGRAALALEGGLRAWSERLDPLLDSIESGRYTHELGPVMAKLVDEWAEGWVKEHKNASKDAANKAGARHLFLLLSERVRRRVHAAAEKHPDDLESALRAVDLLAEAERHIDSNVNMALALENMVVQTARA